MKLLDSKNLENSAIVANNTMNRERNLLGVNSYAKDIQLDVINYLTKITKTKDQYISWADLCCGRGKALIQAAQIFRENYPKKHIFFEGIDLVNFFDPIPIEIKTLSLSTNSLLNWNSQIMYNLITCVHGLHYIGDKIKAIQIACKHLKPNGKFIANLDLNSIKIRNPNSNKQALKKFMKENNLNYNSRKKILICDGYREICHNFTFLGADDLAGPNYTGQHAVDAYYLYNRS